MSPHNGGAELEAVKHMMAELERWIPQRSRDPSVFGFCTECARHVCCNCFGVCPVDLCSDTLCTECHPAVDRPCDWHQVLEEEAAARGS